MKKQVEEWIRYAKIDLLSAEKLLEDEFLTQSVAFHAHQAIEKSLKAILEHQNIKILRTHDLDKLYGMVQETGINFDEMDEDILTQINDVYIDSRYPTDMGLIPNGIPSTKKAKAFFNLAQKIYLQVLKLLESE